MQQIIIPFVFSVIPASKARRESIRNDSHEPVAGQAGITEIWNCGRDRMM